MTKLSTDSGLKANQGGNQASRVSSMLQKTAHVVYGTKTSQNQNHGHLTIILVAITEDSAFCFLGH